ncbi:MAG TPA: IPT/TIG domain-containing protein [Nitrospiria bacterium]|jgi:YD repeat-containing protein
MNTPGKSILNYRKSAIGWGMGLILFILLFPSVVKTDEARYFYDDLGRLIGVVDGQGDVAVYNYDAVGNLLSIERFASSGTDIGILALSPSKGEVGIDVEIQGYGFSPTPADNQVAFNGTAATVSSSTPNIIIAAVPSGATTGPVTVTNSNGTATSPEPFTVVAAPTISGIDPDRVGQGTTITAVIYGDNLSDSQAVTFSGGGILAEILPGATSDSLPIQLTVGSNAPVGDYTFTITTSGGEAQSDPITVTVAPAMGSFYNARLSVFMPLITDVPGTVSPSGPTQSAAPPVSVRLPVISEVPAAVAPSGQGYVSHGPTSVEMPITGTVPATSAPSGSTMSVAPPESVFMPE